MDKKTQNLMFSSKTDEWETPETIFNKLNQRYKFTLDPCASVHNAKCTKYFTKEDDGLAKSWKDQVVFVNPPYSNVKEWVAKSHQEATSNGATVVMLIPSRTDTRYWHDYIMSGADKIYFVKGRLKFGNKDHQNKNSAPFPSAIIVFGENNLIGYTSGPKIYSMDRNYGRI
jgi:phage N-6-adenine-methyltransferase